ncbi:hypothetical protein VTO73DRAFT_12850 [Trametes versicolor]
MPPLGELMTSASPPRGTYPKLARPAPVARRTPDGHPGLPGRPARPLARTNRTLALPDDDHGPR